MYTAIEYENLKVSAIVPAYNEAKNILNVLKPLKQEPAIQEIILVSDGSTDDTPRLAEELGGVKVLALPQNVGKTKAVARGVAEAEYPTILLCDADLVNLKQEHVSKLIEKYCEGWDMVILEMGSQPWVFQRLLQSTPALSGTRILDKEHFLKVPFRETDRFQFETRINDYFLGNGLAIAVSPAKEIHDTRKFIKYPFLKGLILDIKGGWEVGAPDGPSSIFRTLRMFRKIRRLMYSPPPPDERVRL